MFCDRLSASIPPDTCVVRHERALNGWNPAVGSFRDEGCLVCEHGVRRYAEAKAMGYPKTKRCIKCDTVRPAKDFRYRSTRICKDCQSAVQALATKKASRLRRRPPRLFSLDNIQEDAPVMPPKNDDQNATPNVASAVASATPNVASGNEIAAELRLMLPTALYQAIEDMAMDELRSVSMQAVWILREYMSERSAG